MATLQWQIQMAQMLPSLVLGLQTVGTSCQLSGSTILGSRLQFITIMQCSTGY